MQCLVCQQLTTEFAEATTSYSITVEHMAQIAGPNHKSSFPEVHHTAMQEFERCNRALDALERHRSAVHLNRYKPELALGSKGAGFIELENRPGEC
jgi:hypothetical protein